MPLDGVARVHDRAMPFDVDVPGCGSTLRQPVARGSTTSAPQPRKLVRWG